MPPREPTTRQRVALRKSWKVQPILPARLEKAAHYTQRFAVLQGKPRGSQIRENSRRDASFFDIAAAMLRIE